MEKKFTNGRQNIMKNDLDRKRKKWNNITKRHIEDYFISHPKHGVKIKEILERYNLNPKRILEIGAFSAKDSRYLALEYPNCEVYAVDLSEKAVEESRRISMSMGVKNHYILQENAFNLSFKENYFDISFHSGFYILFWDNKDILKLFKEQKRITKNFVIIFVHNKYSFIHTLIFWYLANIKKDPLYKIRRYSLKELKSIFNNEEIIEANGIDNYILDITNKFGKGLIGRPILPKFLRNMINNLRLFKRPFFCEIIYIVIKKGR